jgi:hypothetical protein
MLQSIFGGHESCAASPIWAENGMSMPFAMPVGVLLILKHFRTVVLVSKGARICRFVVYRVSVFGRGGRAVKSPRAFGFNCKWTRDSHPLVRCLGMFFGIICAVEEFCTIQPGVLTITGFLSIK